MNKLSSLVLAASFLAAISVLGPERAHGAEPRPGTVPTVIGTITPPKFLLTTVRGNIKVAGIPAPSSGPLAGWGCDDLSVSVESKEQVPPAPGNLFPTPKWSKGAKATGNWASGTCSFTIAVPPNSQFYVRVGANAKDYPCDYIGGLFVSPSSSPVMSVPKGTSKSTPDFTASGAPTCSFIY